MSDVKLLPCPFCGEYPIVTKCGGAEIRCASCEMGPNTGHYSDPSAAVALWNTRALTPKQRAADVLYEALNAIVAALELGGNMKRGQFYYYGVHDPAMTEPMATARAALAKAGQQ